MQRGKWLHILIITIILGLTLVACGDNSQSALPTVAPITPITATIVPTATPRLTPIPDWQRNWLKGVPCRLPCWEGITPGITTYDEAVKLLSTNPRVTNLRITDQNGSLATVGVGVSFEKLKAVEWNWGGLAQGEILSNPNDKREVKFIRPAYGVSFSLTEVIAAYGEPQLLQAYTQPNDIGQTYELILIYEKYGFSLGTGWAKPITLEGDLTFRDFTIFGLSIENLRLEAIIREKWLQPWQGFKDYDYSCPRVAYLINGCGKLPGKAP